MDVLDTTHAAREEEMAWISEELNAVKEEKDTLIKKLLWEVETLRKSRNARFQFCNSVIAELESCVRSMEQENMELRQQVN
jgi:hypothetical protein